LSVSAKRIRAGDVILAAGSLLLLASIIVHVAAAPAAPSNERAPHKHDPSEAVPRESAAAASPVAVTAAAAEPVAPAGGEYEPPHYVPNSRSIQSWKDLPVHVLNRPHWVSGRAHPKAPNGDGIDYKLRNAELHLELLGYDTDSIRFGFDLVNRLDAALTAGREGDAAARLLELARGGPEAAALAAATGDGVDESGVRIRALAMLAAHGGVEGVADLVSAIATSDKADSVRTAAGAALLWMSRPAETARWVAFETSSQAVSDFFDSVQIGVNKLDDRRLSKTLVFTNSRAVESAALVDALMEGSSAARWEPSTRAKMYSVAALYGGERADVGAWMEREYARTGETLARASILFAAPGLANSRGLEDRAIEVARAGGSGYLVRTALFSLSQFRSERAFRVLMEVTPKCGEDTARHAIRGLERLEPWYGPEIEPFLRTLAAGHPDAKMRAEAAAALARSFTKSRS
jgi:hypothetical protein